MKIPFYQSSWNGVNLLDLSLELEHDLATLPNDKFYAAYYDKISANNKMLSDDWKHNKQHQSDWLEHQILSYGGNKQKILSVGAGTGIIEIPLINRGYDIHLQEFQSKSLKLFGASDLTSCYYGELDLIKGVKFDLIITIAMTYALDDQKLNSFFRSCANLLSENGTLIILDTSLSWREIYVYLRNYKNYAKSYLIWGYKRSIQHFASLAAGFEYMTHMYYGQSMELLPLKTIFQIPFNSTPAWQMGVFRKND